MQRKLHPLEGIVAAFALVFVLALTIGFAQAASPKPLKPAALRSASVIMLDAQISAANGHYKTVLESIADRTTAASLAKDKTEQERIKSDLAKLTAEKKSSEEQIKALVAKYNAALKKN